MTVTVSEACNIRCPKCREDDRIDICANVWIRLCPDGTDIAAAENTDHEWDNDSLAVCGNCQHAGPVRQFDIDKRSEGS